MEIKIDSTNQIIEIFIQDSASTTGAGKTGLAYNTSGLTCYYKRSVETVSVSIALADITTLGTYVSGGFKEINATNMPGVYEFHPPNAAFASGATEVVFLFKGDAAGMAPLPLRITLKVNTEQDIYDRIGTPAGGSVSVDVAAVKSDTGGLRIDYSTTRAGKIDNLDVTVSSRATQASVDIIAGYIDTEVAAILTAVDTEVAAIKAKTDNLPASPAATGDIPSATTIADAVWASTTRTLTSFGTLVTDIWGYSSRTLTAFSTALALSIWDVLESVIATANSIGLKLKTNLDATVSSRLSSAGYTAPDNTSISAIKAKTDNLPADPASTTQVNTRLATSGYTAPDNAGISAIKTKTDTIVWTDITDIKDESLGKWSINKSTNILTLYKADGVTVLKQFNLTDNASVSERVPV